MVSGDIAATFDCAWPTTSGHLSVLREAGLIEAEREGGTIRYRLNISAVEEAAAFLLDLVRAGETPRNRTSSVPPGRLI